MLNVHRNNGKTARRGKTEIEAREGALMNCRMEMSDFVDAGESRGNAHFGQTRGNTVREKQKDRRGRVAAVEERDGVLADCVSLRNV